MSALNGRELWVGEFRVAPALDEISRDGVTTKIEPRTMRLLVCLAERPGQVVSVEELLDLVWKDVVVSTDSVYQAVGSLRRILGDDPKQPRYIANVMRRGYRLIADVKAVSTVPEVRIQRRPSSRLPLLLAVAGCLVVAVVTAQKFWWRKSATGAEQSSAIATSANSDKSVAVLPFLDLSENKDAEYFADGMAEELISALAKVSELRIPARTSSFYFKGKQATVSEIAKALHVDYVLEGSVRKSGSTLRATVQLIRASNGYHLWSETYDKDLGDVLKLQTEIATAVAGALKVTLLGEEAANLEIGGTHTPAALEAYLHASKAYWQENLPTAIEGYGDAIGLDPNYALAYASRSAALITAADRETTQTAARADLEHSRADAAKAIALAPNLSEGHLALALVNSELLLFAQATEEYERALALGPGNARILRDYGLFAAFMGRGDFGLQLLQRAVALDPLNPNSTGHLANGLLWLRRYPEARAAFEETDTHGSEGPTAMIGFTYYLQGDYEHARSTCEGSSAKDEIRWVCLALANKKLGRQRDAETVLQNARAKYRDDAALSYVMVYAQWGNSAAALDWIETASRRRDKDLILLNQPMFDPLRSEPRFHAVFQDLQFPK